MESDGWGWGGARAAKRQVRKKKSGTASKNSAVPLIERDRR
jgi:hypothetical protein